jgi:cytochrome c553
MSKRVRKKPLGSPGSIVAAILGVLGTFHLSSPALSGTLKQHAEQMSPEAPRASDANASIVPKQELQTKLAYCQECHGSSARGFRAYYSIPRLAGQQTEYLKNQLQAFVEHRRKNNIMFNVSRVLSPAMIVALAAQFQDLNPKPLGGAPKELVASGKTIFEGGIPDANVPACSSCHGLEAKGQGPFPRLAGQLSDYISEKLTNWDRERGQDPTDPDTSAVMQPIARGLTKSQIEAVAAYLSELE